VVVRQFDIVHNPNKQTRQTRQTFPYLVVLQHEIIDVSNTVVVAPLIPRTSTIPADRLHPKLTVDGDTFTLVTHDLGATKRSDLVDMVTNVADQRNEIIAALDLVFTGI